LALATTCLAGIPASRSGQETLERLGILILVFAEHATDIIGDHGQQRSGEPSLPNIVFGQFQLPLINLDQPTDQAGSQDGQPQG
jgi:hypothetical protein